MESPSPQDKPPVFNYVLSFLLVGIAWGGTTPFIRKAAKSHKPPQHQILNDPAVQASWLRSKLYGVFFSVVDLLRNPRYAVPLLLNLTGSVWFFLLIGQAELSLTVPIVNTMAFLFTVLGEWLVEGKVISRVFFAKGRLTDNLGYLPLTVRIHANRNADTGAGMLFSLVGIGLCVYSKT